MLHEISGGYSSGGGPHVPAGSAHDPCRHGCCCSSLTGWTLWLTIPLLIRPRFSSSKEDIGYEIVVLYDGEQHLTRLLQPREDLVVYPRYQHAGVGLAICAHLFATVDYNGQETKKAVLYGKRGDTYAAV